MESTVRDHPHDAVFRVEEATYETGTLLEFWNKPRSESVLVSASPRTFGMMMEDVTGLVQERAHPGTVGGIKAEFVRDLVPAIIERQLR